ncbi:MAG: hypothetical protein H0X30_12110 [Anaerolineae bacterium]|nr:hypothetical protein [Anaerolineae bacterium]
MFDVTDFMKELATKRPIFHSEADFQHAFAWQFREWYPTANIRLEYPVHVDSKWIYADIWISLPEVNLAIELKYKTVRQETYFNNEPFHLKNHGAQDLGRYDFLKDVTRLEYFKKLNGVEGYAILLTNDYQYWGAARRETVDKNFRLHENRNLTGELSWYGTPSLGTIRKREDMLPISGNYYCNWQAYSKLDGHNLEFRYLALKI